jgi:hypothetical protein
MSPQREPRVDIALNVTASPIDESEAGLFDAGDRGGKLFKIRG